MLLTVKAKLLPTPDQKEKLLGTMERFNKACNSISEFAYKQSCFHYFRLHQLMYKRVIAAGQHQISQAASTHNKFKGEAVQT
jgi:predicted transposase